MKKTFHETIMHEGFISKLGAGKNELNRDLEQAEIFNIQNVTDYYYASGQEFWEVDVDFPNLAPPFPTFFMEYIEPETINSEEFGRNKNPLSGARFGCLFKSDKVPLYPEKTDRKWTTWIAIFFQIPGHPIIQPAVAFLTVDQYGQVGNVKEYYKMGIPTDSPDPESERKFFQGLLHPMLLAISFLHCKNIEIIPHDPLHIPGKRARRGSSHITIHTLQIDRLKKILEDEGESETTGMKNALHICRGHFKDFSKGKGLFGKYKDLFWWDDQVRGKLDRGIVLKDYNINA